MVAKSSPKTASRTAKKPAAASSAAPAEPSAPTEGASKPNWYESAGDPGTTSGPTTESDYTRGFQSGREVGKVDVRIGVPLLGEEVANRLHGDDRKVIVLAEWQIDYVLNALSDKMIDFAAWIERAHPAAVASVQRSYKHLEATIHDVSIQAGLMEPVEGAQPQTEWQSKLVR